MPSQIQSKMGRRTLAGGFDFLAGGQIGEVSVPRVPAVSAAILWILHVDVAPGV
jgi:hypothetical protein